MLRSLNLFLAVTLMVGTSLAAQRVSRTRAPSVDRSSIEHSANGPSRERSSDNAISAGEVAARRDAAAARAPSPSPAQQESLTALRDDLSTLGQGAHAAQDELAELATDLSQMALQPPDQALVQDLAASLQTAFADSQLSPKETAQLTQDLYALMNSAGLSQDEIEVLIADVEAILLASGVERSDVAAVVDDIEALAGGAQAGGSRSGVPSAAESRRLGRRHL